MTVLLGACRPGTAPSAASVLVVGAEASGACEAAVVRRAEHIRDHGGASSDDVDADVFASCSFDAFVAANAKLTDAYRLPGDGRTYVGRNCDRLFAIHRGSRLCRSR